ncbi:hypothetical protein DL546_000047, partial [Coniochaeta pulveracea]
MYKSNRTAVPSDTLALNALGDYRGGPSDKPDMIPRRLEKSRSWGPGYWCMQDAGSLLDDQINLSEFHLNLRLLCRENPSGPAIFLGLDY